jgi:hypothetical protein
MTDLDGLFGAQQRNLRDSIEQAARECSERRLANESMAQAARLPNVRKQRKPKPEPERARYGAKPRPPDAPR